MMLDLNIIYLYSYYQYMGYERSNSKEDIVVSGY